MHGGLCSDLPEHNSSQPLHQTLHFHTMEHTIKGDMGRPFFLDQTAGFRERSQERRLETGMRMAAAGGMSRMIAKG